MKLLSKRSNVFAHSVVAAAVLCGAPVAGLPTPGGSTNLISVLDRRDLNIGRIGLNYRFDTLAPAPVVARF